MSSRPWRVNSRCSASTPAISLVCVELTTDRLLLTPLNPDRDAEALHTAYSDPDVMRWWNTPLRDAVADTRRDLESILDGDGAHVWAVRETDKAVGLVGLLGDVAVPGLAWMLSKQAWGRGLMTEAAAAVPAGSASPNTAVSRNGIHTGSKPTSRSSWGGHANQSPPPCSMSKSPCRCSTSLRRWAC
jgi:GNAT acetyltransferase-like protein